VIAALSFRDPAAALTRLAALPSADWEEILSWTDRKRLTLQLFARLDPYQIPDDVREALETRREKNRRRLALLRDETAKVLAILQAEGLRASILKGLTLAPNFVPNLDLRQQYDLDLYLSERNAVKAHGLLLSRGSYAVDQDNEGRASHLPALIPKSSWEWRGDFFDLEIPMSVELHFRLWNAKFECLAIAYPEPQESLIGQLASVVLHMMRHVFHGNLTLSHVYELAYFLEHHFDEQELWHAWRRTDPALQELSTAAFAIAGRVFDCRLPDVPVQHDVAAWVRRFGLSVIEQEHAGKSQVLLQLALVRSWPDRVKVLRRRLFPLNVPGPVDGAYLAPEILTLSRRVRRAWRRSLHVAGRAWYHVRSLFGFVRAFVIWRWECR